MRPRDLLRALKREPLAYREQARRGGSHVWLVSERGYPDVRWSFHPSVTHLPPGLVRKILCKDIGLTAAEALDILEG